MLNLPKHLSNDWGVAQTTFSEQYWEWYNWNFSPLQRLASAPARELDFLKAAVRDLIVR